MILLINYFTINDTAGDVSIEINPVAVVVLLIFAAISLDGTAEVVSCRDWSGAYQQDKTPYPKTGPAEPEHPQDDKLYPKMSNTNPRN